jgi:hypothetical protein
LRKSSGNPWAGEFASADFGTGEIVTFFPGLGTFCTPKFSLRSRILHEVSNKRPWGHAGGAFKPEGNSLVKIVVRHQMPVQIRTAVACLSSLSRALRQVSQQFSPKLQLARGKTIRGLPLRNLAKFRRFFQAALPILRATIPGNKGESAA